MHIDPDIIRKILLAVEEAPPKPAWNQIVPKLDGVDTAAAAYNALHLRDKGLLKFYQDPRIHRASGQWVIGYVELLPPGHDALAVIRDATFLAKCKAAISSGGREGLTALIKAAATGASDDIVSLILSWFP